MASMGGETVGSHRMRSEYLLTAKRILDASKVPFTRPRNLDPK